MLNPPYDLCSSVQTCEPSQHVRNIRVVVNEVVNDHFNNAIKDFQSDNFVGPIMEVVQNLPKEELGGMTEAMVNLTSLKRRVSLDQETVGGPVDISII